MRTRFIPWLVLATVTFSLAATSRQVDAAEPFNFFTFLMGKGTDVHPHHCDQCGNVHKPDGPCIERYPVEDCVVGHKKVYDCRTCNEYVSIPETRYRWKKKLITKEIPCPYCKPVCKTEPNEHCFGEEKWVKQCDKCNELHCKHIQPRTENLPCRYCDHEPGETTIRVRYWSCVKEPYTVYRRVKRSLCIKEPRYVKVDVPVTRYICNHCGGAGCGQCDK